jgi:putative ABC transport system substrate-binding protein
MKRIGIFLNLVEDDPQASARIAAFREGLQSHGWADSDYSVDVRYGADSLKLRDKNAAELVALAPDIIQASSGHIIEALLQAMKKEKRTIPIVFAGVIEPYNTGKVDSLTHPSNATGFGSIAFSIGAKWLELLKQLAPHVRRVLVIRDSHTPAGVGQFRAMHEVKPSPGVDLLPIDVVDAGEIEQAIAEFAREPDGGVIVTASTLAARHRPLITSLVNRHRLPAVFPNRMYALGGGVLAYGPVTLDLYRSAAGYADRILKGAKPADLPVQTPAKYALDINLKTAKALGIDVPPALLAAADQVIE